MLRFADVTITEPSRLAGTLRILACFDNGAVSGEGVKYGIGSALEMPYRVMGPGYRLQASTAVHRPAA